MSASSGAPAAGLLSVCSSCETVLAGRALDAIGLCEKLLSWSNVLCWNRRPLEHPLSGHKQSTGACVSMLASGTSSVFSWCSRSDRHTPPNPLNNFLIMLFYFEKRWWHCEHTETLSALMDDHVPLHCVRVS